LDLDQLGVQVQNDSMSKRCDQSDKIWRIDLQDDLKSCHPVGLRMTVKF